MNQRCGALALCLCAGMWLGASDTQAWSLKWIWGKPKPKKAAAQSTSFDKGLLEKAGLSVAWQRSLNCGKVARVYMTEHRLFVESARATLNCVDLDTGWVRWTVDLRHPLMFPPFEMAGASAYPQRSHVFVVNDKDETKNHTLRLPNLMPSAPLAYRKGFLVGCSTDDRLFKVDVHAGRSPWPLGRGQHLNSVLHRPVLSQGNIIYTSEDDGGTLHCADEGTGLEVWSRVQGCGLTRPVLVGGTVLLGTSNGFLIAYDAKTGKVRWEFVSAKSLLDAPQVAGQTVFQPCRRYGIYAIDMKTGKEKWWADGDQVRLLAMGKRLAYLGFNEKTIIAVDAEKGEPRWQLVPEAYTIFTTNTRSSMVYLASPTGDLIALKEE